MTASEAAAAVAAGALTPLELVQAALARIAAIEDRVKAWAYLDAEGALAEAELQTAEAKAGKLRGPLHGVPVGLKDVFHVKGMPTRANSKATDDVPEPEDSAAAAGLRAAGAIIFGKLQTVEFASGGGIPPTMNPWNGEHTAGGSSSGSGAAVGARMIKGAIGTQTGGSNLRPAAYNGIAGFMATYGRFSRYGLHTVSYSLDHPGIIAPSVADLGLIFAAVAGPDPKDDTTLPDGAFVWDEEAMTPASPPRIGVVRDFFLEKSEPVMRQAVEDAAAKLGAAEASVREVPLPEEFGLHQPAHHLIMQSELATVQARRHAARPADIHPARQVSFEVASLIPGNYYLQAQRIRRMLAHDLLSLFDGIDVLLMPTAPGPSPKGLASTGDASLLTPWTFLGYPAISIPCGLSPDGLPLGLQFVAPPMADEYLLKAGLWAEGILGRMEGPPIA
jgi:aspartyl-tRNA(Asn)/glutamyl-tRNA(Gln) amidotransferase subunit A